MSEQLVDLRSAWAILRRRRRALIIAAALGGLAGGATVYLLPDNYSSTSVVLLPPASNASGVAASRDIDTQVEIVGSDVVLRRAGESVRPRLSADIVADRVEVTAPTTDVLRITASGPSAAEAESLAGAVAAAHVAYLRDAASSISESRRNLLTDRAATLKESLAAVMIEIRKTSTRLQQEKLTSTAGKADSAALAELTAQQANLVIQIDQVEAEMAAGGQPVNGLAGGSATVIQEPSPAARTPLPVRIAMVAGLGAGLAVFLTAVCLVLTGRREQTLRSRDEIADSIGVPAVASLRSRMPTAVAGWTQLLEGYAPEDVDRWALRQLLRLVLPGPPGKHAPQLPAVADASTTVVVITVSDDLNALAFGPQLASYAAGTGLRTELVAAQMHESANALWAALAQVPEGRGPRPDLTVHARQDDHYRGDLVVHLAVIDRRQPSLVLSVAEDAVTLFAVTAGSATPQDLARVAVAADTAGLPLDGLIVVNPDPLDRTTGRLLVAERTQQVALPIRTTGSPIASGSTLPIARWRRQ